ncbi:MAG TPA: NAD-dependent epimerase/dehydratase family protein [Mycobacteriales bacterium]|nr:NAD-dependent epimerase/dehydratase family protein [Mycobacteriales bacterium]
MPSPVLVTGSTGFLGSALVRALRADGSPVRGVDVRPSATTDLVADLLDDGAWQDAAQEAPVVVHTAALVGERGRRARFEALNVEGTRRVLAAAGGRVVHVSSIVVHGNAFAAGPDGVGEDGPVRPTGNPYTDTKIAAEHLALAAAARGRGVVVVRPGDVYGPGSVPWTVRPVQMLRAGRLAAPSTGVLSPVFVDDVVDGLVRAVRSGAADGRPVHLAGPPVPAAEFFRHYARMAGRGLPVVPTGLLRALATPLGLLGERAPLSRRTLEYVTHPAGYSVARAAELLGWRPQVDLDEGMRRTEQWLREEGLL